MLMLAASQATTTHSAQSQEGVISIKSNTADVEVQPASRDVPLLEHDDFMSSSESSPSPLDQVAHEGAARKASRRC